MVTQPGGIPLIILDVQDAIDQPAWDGKNNPGYLGVIQQLLTVWRCNRWPVLHIRHDEVNPASSYHTHGPGNRIKKEVMPIDGETVVAKQQNCAFIGTELDRLLKDMQTDTFILTGVVIHNSMDATIRAGKALGYQIILPADATTAVAVASPDGRSWDAESVYDLSLAILGGEYAEVTTADQVISRFAYSDRTDSQPIAR